MDENGESHEEIVPGFDDIFKEIRQSESNGSDEALFHYNLGTAFQKTGRFDEAIEELKKAAEDPKRATDSYLRLADCTREKNMFKEATDYLKKGLRTKDLSPAKKLNFSFKNSHSDFSENRFLDSAKGRLPTREKIKRD